MRAMEVVVLVALVWTTWGGGREFFPMPNLARCTSPPYISPIPDPVRLVTLVTGPVAL